MLVYTASRYHMLPLAQNSACFLTMQRESEFEAVRRRFAAGLCASRRAVRVRVSSLWLRSLTRQSQPLRFTSFGRCTECETPCSADSPSTVGKRALSPSSVMTMNAEAAGITRKRTKG